MKRIAPDNGPEDVQDPLSPEGLQQAEEDRRLQMSVWGLTEDDFPDETIWVGDDVPDDE